MLDVRSIRGANIDSDHYLVAAKIRTRLCANKNRTTPACRRLDVGKLQSQETAESYSTRLNELLHATEAAPELDQQWQNIAQSMLQAAEEKVGYHKSQKLTWYDEECRQAAIDKDIAYRATLRAAATRATYERNRLKRREEKRLFRKKRNEFMIRECEDIEMLGSRNEARRFHHIKSSAWPKVTGPGLHSAKAKKEI